MIALIIGQCDGDGVFAFADKLVVIVAGSMSEDHSCALYRDTFAIPHDIDRLGWNAIELRERALDGSSVDVGLISFSEFSGCVTTMIRDRCQTHSTLGTAHAIPGFESCG